MTAVLVTGASGFVGRRLCKVLGQQGSHVTALHRRDVPGPWQRQLLVDLAAPGPALELPGDIVRVFHLAGYAHADGANRADALHQATSVEGTRRLLCALGPRVRHLVYFSSVKAMGECTPLQGVDETTPCRPTTGYGRARLEAEALVAAASREGLRTTVLRLPLIYGPGVRGNLRRMLHAVRAGRMPRLPGFGNRRSMVHVDDACRAALCAVEAQCQPTRTYLLSDGEDLEPREVVAMMYAACGRRPLIPRVPRQILSAAARAGDWLEWAGFSRVPFSAAALEKLRHSAVYDASLITRETGWQPRLRLRDALPAMLSELQREARE